jgi:hypothetical protein
MGKVSLDMNAHRLSNISLVSESVPQTFEVRPLSALETRVLTGLFRYLSAPGMLIPAEPSFVLMIVGASLKQAGTLPSLDCLALAIDRLVETRQLRRVIVGFEAHLALRSESFVLNLPHACNATHALHNGALPEAAKREEEAAQTTTSESQRFSEMQAAAAKPASEPVENPVSISAQAEFSKSVRSDLESERALLYRVAIVVLLIVGLCLLRCIALQWMGK